MNNQDRENLQHIEEFLNSNEIKFERENDTTFIINNEQYDIYSLTSYTVY